MGSFWVTKRALGPRIKVFVLSVIPAKAGIHEGNPSGSRIPTDLYGQVRDDNLFLIERLEYIHVNYTVEKSFNRK